jgi:hypothetical protein
LIGLIGDWTFRKHFQFSSGIQYQITGKHSHELDVSSNNSQTEIWREFKFHKLCIPITIGYLFSVNKVRPSVYCGLRPNIFLYGRLSEKYLDTYWTGHTYTLGVEKWNPFDRDQVHKTARRITNQCLIGISTAIGSHFKFSINYNVGNNKYVRYNHPTWDKDIVDSIDNSDFGITISYRLNQKNTKLMTIRL